MPDQADYSYHSLYFQAGDDDWRFQLVLKPGGQGPVVWFRYSPAGKNGEIYYENFAEDDLIHPFGRPCGEMIVVSLLSFAGGISIHACGVIREGRVRIFTGTSGAGKSTSAALWSAAPRAEVLSDEVILLYEQAGAIWACGTPWHSSLPLYSSQAGPVEKILFIRHLDENKAVRLAPLQASTRLLARTHLIQWDQRKLAENFDFALRVAQKVACYDFGFLPDASAVEYVECLR